MMPIARVIVADPPWAPQDQLPGEGRGSSKHYRVMATSEICALKIPPTEEDALLFLWFLSSMRQDALDVCRAWRFVPKSGFTWVKLSKTSLNDEMRGRHWDVLLDDRNHDDPSPRVVRNERSYYESKKPR